MSVPGTKGGMYQTNGLEHDETARPASSHVMHEKMSRKRFQKLDFVEEQVPPLPAPRPGEGRHRHRLLGLLEGSRRGGDARARRRRA